MKVKVPPHYVPVLAQMGYGGMTPTHSQPGTGTNWVVSTTLQCFVSGKGPALIVQEARWPWGRSGRVREIPREPAFDPRTVQPVGSRYTD